MEEQGVSRASEEAEREVYKWTWYWLAIWLVLGLLVGIGALALTSVNQEAQSGGTPPAPVRVGEQPGKQ
jgi:hypothetical protein